ncbi:MAG TPA: FAD-dependent monooxygenase [Verrucomicrobiae bacterium]|nr:FAD-dependent monooxygenase [Verrucomicrobiae bacterium]
MAHVAIAGAGPAGAALAYLLARRGLGVTLLERQTDFAREFRGEGLMPSGVEALGAMGLGAALDALPQTRIETLDIFRGTRRVLRVRPQDLGAPGPRMVSQPALLEMLVGEAGRFAGFRLERGVTVRDLVREGERVVGVRIDTPGGSREVRGDLVIGTDGRCSVLRARAGLRIEHAQQAFDVVWCKVPQPAFLDQTTARAYLGHRHFALLFPSYDRRLQIGWIIDKGSFGDLRRLGIEGWIEEMARHVSPDLAAYLRAEGRTITHPFLLDVVCDRVDHWSLPGLLLLGDAAHPMSPVGAQGINIALRDALVAANHLGPALAGGAAPAAIDAATARVAAEREPEVAEIQRLQQGPPRLLFGPAWRGRLVLGALLPLLARLGIVQRVAGSVFRRFANGVTTVRLAA